MLGVDCLGVNWRTAGWQTVDGEGFLYAIKGGSLRSRRRCGPIEPGMRPSGPTRRADRASGRQTIYRSAVEGVSAIQAALSRSRI